MHWTPMLMVGLPLLAILLIISRILWMWWRQVQADARRLEDDRWVEGRTVHEVEQEMTRREQAPKPVEPALQRDRDLRQWKEAQEKVRQANADLQRRREAVARDRRENPQDWPRPASTAFRPTGGGSGTRPPSTGSGVASRRPDEPYVHYTPLMDPSSPLSPLSPLHSHSAPSSPAPSYSPSSDTQSASNSYSSDGGSSSGGGVD